MEFTFVYSKKYKPTYLFLDGHKIVLTQFTLKNYFPTDVICHLAHILNLCNYLRMFFETILSEVPNLIIFPFHHTSSDKINF